MSDDSQTGKGRGKWKWFLRKLVTSPATWFGLGTGVAVGAAYAKIGPIGGAIGLGTMVGTMGGLVVFGITKVVGIAHMQDQGEQGPVPVSGQEHANSKEQSVVENLRSTGQDDDADLLEKMMADRDAIQSRARKQEHDTDAAHTVEMANAIVAEACRQSEELQDLVRRERDPLLDGPEDSESRIASIRAESKRAYQAVADARSRLRRGQRLKDSDFLADPESLSSRNLASLTAQLEEETDIAEKVDERMRSGASSERKRKDQEEVEVEDTMEAPAEERLESE